MAETLFRYLKCAYLFAALTALSFGAPGYTQQSVEQPPLPARDNRWPDARGAMLLLQRLDDEIEVWRLVGEPQIIGDDLLADCLEPDHLAHLRAYGLQWVVRAMLSQTTKGGHAVKVEVWGFGDAANAFGIFSQERAEAMAIEQMGEAAFWSDHELVVWYHTLLIRLTAEEDQRKWKPLLRGLTTELLLRLPELPSPPPIVAILPRGQFAPQTIIYHLPLQTGQQWPCLSAHARDGALGGQLTIYQTDSAAFAAVLFERWSNELATQTGVPPSPFPHLSDRALLLRFNEDDWSLLMLQGEYVCALLGTSNVELAEGILRLVGLKIRMEARGPSASP